MSGIEYLFDAELRGKPIVTKYIKDNKGRPVKFKSLEKGDKAKSITLTIDKEIQYISEKYLKEAVLKYGARKGGIGVLDTRTGEILAIANYPTFDPNSVNKSPLAYRKLSFVSDPFEPGSILKIFTAASALENKIATSDTNYYCEQGSMKISGHVVSDSGSTEKSEWLSLSEIIQYSSNIGVTKVAFDLTYPRLNKTLLNLGIGSKTNIELPGESRGIKSDDENISPIKLSNISFGQGIATTGIQMLAAYGAIANKGLYTRPTILMGQPLEERQKRVLSEETSNELTTMLRSAVEDGTGSNARIKYFRVAGKTSTTQRPDKNGGYKGYISGFIGFPTNVKEKFVIYVYIDDPVGDEYYGNQVAAPVFKKVAEHILFKNKEINHISLAAEKIQNQHFDSVNSRQSSLEIVRP